MDTRTISSLNSIRAINDLHLNPSVDMTMATAAHNATKIILVVGIARITYVIIIFHSDLVRLRMNDIERLKLVLLIINWNRKQLELMR